MPVIHQNVAAHPLLYCQLVQQQQEQQQKQQRQQPQMQWHLCSSPTSSSSWTRQTVA
jgi:hypothetical protein